MGAPPGIRVGGVGCLVGAIATPPGCCGAPPPGGGAPPSAAPTNVFNILLAKLNIFYYLFTIIYLYIYIYMCVWGGSSGVGIGGEK